MKEQFLARMKRYLQDEYPAFIQSYEKPLLRALRYNPKKPMTKLPNLVQSPFCEESYYVNETLGNHAGHISGCFYLQEPSAASAVTILDVQKSDIVLDLCAAPGGKSTQIASRLEDGFLVTNEIDKKRAQILLSNLERYGVENFLLTSMDTKKLCSAYKNCFDKILVDAPCSGEGMMKKHDAASQRWSQENVDCCAKRQKEILANAYMALKKDGYLVYSTCTYAKEENEEVVTWFLENYPDMQLCPPNVSFGRPGYLKDTLRVFPMDGGEGHFVAKFKKREGSVANLPLLKDKAVPGFVETFFKEQLGFVPKHLYMQKDQVYVMDHPFVDTKKVNDIRQGILAGECKKNRFEPAHAFYMNAAWIDTFQKKWDVSLEEMDAYMHGNTIPCTLEKGYYALCFQDIPFGFGKCDGQMMKNKIPKGLRLLPNSHVFAERKPI